MRKLFAPPVEPVDAPDQHRPTNPIKPVIPIRDGAQTVYPPAGQILWAEAAGNYV
jgi:hypothetical protein